MYFGKNFDKAVKQAQANANFFGNNYIVFFDTSGNVRIEHYTKQKPDGIAQIVSPSEAKGD